MTLEQFRNQNAYWRDNYYHYAIHKTTGGAIYLYVVETEKELTQEDLQYVNIMRLDGVDLTQLFKNIQKVGNENYD